MGREVGGGIGMGKTCEPKAFSFQCMTKFTTNKKKKIITVPILAYFFHFFSVSIIHVYFNVINLLIGSAFSPLNDSSVFFSC